MAKIHPLPKNWQRQVENHLYVMNEIERTATALPPGTERQDMLRAHENICNTFTYYMEKYFGSPQKFGEVLRADVEKRLITAGLSIDIVGDKSHWDIPVATPVLMAQRSGKIYEDTYKKMIEGISHFKALHHATPLPPSYTL